MFEARKVWFLCLMACETLPPHPPHYLSLLTMSSLPAGDQLVAEGGTHISLPTQEYDRGRQEKIERQTNKLGVTKSRKEVLQHYMHMRTIASVGY